MTPLTLFFCPGHLSFAPHVILNEIGAAFEPVHVSIKDGATQSAEFKRINPKGKVPVLAADGEIVTESAAIMYYLALRHPDRRLVPDTPLGMSRTIEWTNWLAGILASAVGQNTHPARYSAEDGAHAGIRDKGRENLLAAYAQINDKLAGRAWALDEGYSIVDPMLLIFFRWGNVLALDMRQFSHWCAHVRRMEQRPAVQATLATEGISIWAQ